MRWLDIEDEAGLIGDLDIETFPTILVADEDFDMLFNALEGSKLHEEGVHVGLRRLQD